MELKGFLFLRLACFRLIISLIAELLVGCVWEDLAHTYELGKHWHGTSNMSGTDFSVVYAVGMAEKQHFFPYCHMF